MDVNDEISNIFTINNEIELIEDIEEPYLTSICSTDTSASIFSYHLCNSIESSGVNDITEGNPISVEECFRSSLLENDHEKTYDYDHEIDFNWKENMENTAGGLVAGIRTAELIDRGRKQRKESTSIPRSNMEQRLKREARTNVFFPELKMLRTKIRHCNSENDLRCSNLVKNTYSFSDNIRKSLPNLNTTKKELNVKINANKFPLKTLTGNSILHENMVEDELIKTLLKKIRLQKSVIDDKDVIISELMKKCEELLIKNAEAENVIDRMRLGYFSETSSSTTEGEDNKLNIPSRFASLVTMGGRCRTFLDELYKRKNTSIEGLAFEKSSLDNLSEQISFLLPVMIKGKENFVNYDFYSNSKTLQKNLGTNGEVMPKDYTTPDKNCVSNGDVTYPADVKCSVAYSSLESLIDDGTELSGDFNVPRENGCIENSMRRRNVILSPNHQMLKNVSVFSYFKTNGECLPYAERKFESSLHNVKSNCSVYQSQSCTGSRKFYGNDFNVPLFCYQESNGSKVEEVKDNESSVKTSSECSSFNDKIMDDKQHVPKSKCISDKSDSLLNNIVALKDKNILHRDSDYHQSVILGLQNGINVKIPDQNYMHIRYPDANKFLLEIKNNFVETSEKIRELNEQWKIHENKEEVDSDIENSCSLESIELEPCECWSKTLSQPDTISPQRTYRGCKTPRCSDYPILSPLSLEVSSLECISPQKLIPEIPPEYEVGMKLTDQHSKDILSSDSCSEYSLIEADSNAYNDEIIERNQKSTNISPKKLTQLISSVDKANYLASKLKCKSEELKMYLLLQLENIT